MDEIQVVDNEQAHRLEVKLGAETAFAEYRIADDGIIFPHTVVPDAFEGRGVGSALVRAGLRKAKDADMPVIPLCSFFAGWIAKHPEFIEQVHPRYRERVGG